jgi:hypothetical protein
MEFSYTLVSLVVIAGVCSLFMWESLFEISVLACWLEWIGKDYLDYVEICDNTINQRKQTWKLHFGQTIWNNRPEVLLGTYWGNNLGTWEPNENMKGTHREQGIKQKPPSPPPSKRKKLDPSQVQAEHFHWVHETFISKIVCHHFGRDNGMCKPGDMFPINPHSIPYPLP